ncbi:hypothetical protein TNCV_2454981 [Trichonephila clavipes]|nr:hypothetical protein TNCV_2454981 [Trichonephila clavipes]
MFMSGDLGGQRKCLNSEECSWCHRVAILNVWGCRVLLLKFPNWVGMHNRHEWVQVISKNAYVPVTCQSRIPMYQGSNTIPEPPPA